ncbi:MAG: glycosyltransferase [Myxococcales bacterium]
MERVALRLTYQFCQRGWDARAVFAETEGRDRLLPWAQAQGVSAETTPALRDIYSPHTWRSAADLRRFVIDATPDVVNLHYGGGHVAIKDILSVRLAGRSRVFINVHLPVPWKDASETKRKLTGLAGVLCDGLIAHSSPIRDLLIEAGVPARKIHLIPNGVSPPEKFVSREEARATWGIAPDAFVVGTVARLAPIKGIADLIEATARIPDPHGKLMLLIVGDGPDRAALEQLADRLLGNRVRFLGAIETGPEALYAAMDVFALPSLLEGLPMVYLEAAFHGIPSVGTDVGGAAEAVLDGETGLLVPVRDIDALAESIQRLRDRPELRARMSAAARTRALAEFTETLMADRYEAVFETVASTRAIVLNG